MNGSRSSKTVSGCDARNETTNFNDAGRRLDSAFPTTCAQQRPAPYATTAFMDDLPSPSGCDFDAQPAVYYAEASQRSSGQRRQVRG
jgi:hypothetical protein